MEYNQKYIQRILIMKRVKCSGNHNKKIKFDITGIEVHIKGNDLFINAKIDENEFIQNRFTLLDKKAAQSIASSIRYRIYKAYKKSYFLGMEGIRDLLE